MYDLKGIVDYEDEPIDPVMIFPIGDDMKEMKGLVGLKVWQGRNPRFA